MQIAKRLVPPDILIAEPGGTTEGVSGAQEVAAVFNALLLLIFKVPHVAGLAKKVPPPVTILGLFEKPERGRFLVDRGSREWEDRERGLV